MMRKLFGLLTALIPLTLGACAPLNGGNNNPSNDNESSSLVEDEAVVVKGMSTLTWHVNETFICTVNVTIKADKILAVEICEGSIVHTDVFTGYDTGKDAYLAQYIGKDVHDIVNLKISDPEDVNNHYDGGKIDGCVDAITGASASSTVIAKAIKDACVKYLARQ